MGGRCDVKEEKLERILLSIARASRPIYFNPLGPVQAARRTGYRKIHLRVATMGHSAIYAGTGVPTSTHRHHRINQNILRIP